ncbi:hypothetical protein [Ancylobacter sp. TS-1]|uniref:hypothetical protein n=1 Tax=Ancylobacter sp. TS-1 TaxID=1850374 RepID=UPI001265AEE6|nr:hypothetical protein [Ancylobacter sp. TS-1]QFR32398.1 hypothetical protein GBB76_04300 [Ancylobacter sp. TS-1]
MTAALSAGCATTKPADPSSWCKTNEPWIVSNTEFAAMSPANKVKLVTHNEYGEKHCGWKPVGGA